MAKKQSAASSSEKCPKVWEKNRRDKMKGMFEELSKLLPAHDPTTPLPRMKVVQEALSYIRELQAQNEDLLNGGFDEVHRKKLECWKKRVKELVTRVDQLTGILRTANIHVPPLALEVVPTWTKSRPKQWSDKLSIPEEKVEEVLEQIKATKRKKKMSDKVCKPAKKPKKNSTVSEETADHSSKENVPASKTNSTKTSNTVSKSKKQGIKIVLPPSTVQPPQPPPPTIGTSVHPAAGILQGSIMTPIVQPSTFILTSQGNLLPVLTQSANLISPVVLNKPPMLVVQQPTVPKPLPIILARPPVNKRRIQRESTVMTFSNKLPIPALSTHSHPRRGGKCTTHKTQSKPVVTLPSTLNNLPTVTVLTSTNETLSSNVDVPCTISNVNIDANPVLQSTTEDTQTVDNKVTLEPITQGVVVDSGQNSSSCKEKADQVNAPCGKVNEAPENGSQVLVSTATAPIEMEVTRNPFEVYEKKITLEIASDDKKVNKLGDVVLSADSESNIIPAVSASASVVEVSKESNSKAKSTDVPEKSSAFTASVSISVVGNEANAICKLSEDSVLTKGIGRNSSALNGQTIMYPSEHSHHVTEPSPSLQSNTGLLPLSPSKIPTNITLRSSNSVQASLPSLVVNPASIISSSTDSHIPSTPMPSESNLSASDSASNAVISTPAGLIQGTTTKHHVPAYSNSPSVYSNMADSIGSQTSAPFDNFRKGKNEIYSGPMQFFPSIQPGMGSNIFNPVAKASAILPLQSSNSSSAPASNPQIVSLSSVALTSTSTFQSIPTSSVPETNLITGPPTFYQTHLASSKVVGSINSGVHHASAHLNSPYFPKNLQNSNVTNSAEVSSHVSLPLPYVSSNSVSQKAITGNLPSTHPHLAPSTQASSSCVPRNQPNSGEVNSIAISTSCSSLPLSSLVTSQPVPTSSTEKVFTSCQPTSQVHLASSKTTSSLQTSSQTHLVPPKVDCSRTVAHPASLQVSSPYLPRNHPNSSDSTVSTSCGSLAPPFSATTYSVPTSISENVFTSSRTMHVAPPNVDINNRSVARSTSVHVNASNIPRNYPSAAAANNPLFSNLTILSPQSVNRQAISSGLTVSTSSMPTFTPSQTNITPYIPQYSSNSIAAFTGQPSSTASISEGFKQSSIVVGPERNVSSSNSVSSSCLTSLTTATSTSQPTISSNLSLITSAAPNTYPFAGSVKSMPAPITVPYGSLLPMSESSYYLKPLEGKPIISNTSVYPTPSSKAQHFNKEILSVASQAQTIPISNADTNKSHVQTSMQVLTSSPKAPRPKDSSATGKHLSYVPKHNSTPFSTAETPVNSSASVHLPVFQNRGTQRSSVSSSAMPRFSSASGRSITQDSWTNVAFSGPTAVPISQQSTDVVWPPINPLAASHLPPVSGCDQSWLLPSAAPTFNEGNNLLPTSSASWRPLPNDIFWNSCGDNWAMPTCKEIVPPPTKKINKNQERSVSGVTKSTPGAIVPPDHIQWPINSTPVEITSHMALYPFSSGSGLYSSSLPVPITEPTWSVSIPKSFGQENILSTNNKGTSAPSMKAQCKDPVYYPTMPYLPPATNYCPQDNFYPNNATFLEPCGVTVPTSNQPTFSKSMPKQSIRSSPMTAKSFPNISHPASPSHQTTKTNPTETNKQTCPVQSRSNFITSASTPTYISSTSSVSAPSKVSVSDTFFPTCHYSVADSGMYNPFAENSYTSSLLKQSIPENPTYAFTNPYPNETSNNPYQINVPKTLLNDPSFGLAALKTTRNDTYYSGVHSYTSSTPCVLPPEPVPYPNTVPKSANSETRHTLLTSHSSKPPVSESSALDKGNNQISGAKNVSTSSYPTVKVQETNKAPNFVPNIEQKPVRLQTSKCDVPTSGSVAVKTSVSAPVWNSSYFGQPISSESTMQWGHSDYTCLTESKDSRPKPPINWMTEPEHRPDIACPTVDQPRYHAERKGPQNSFEYGPSDVDTGKLKTRKKDTEPISQDYYNWAGKIDPLVVPGTLPTLVGDLALGGEPLPSKRDKAAIFLPTESYLAPRKESSIGNSIPHEAFLNLPKNTFDFAQNDNLKPSTETVVIQNLFESPAPPPAVKQKPPQAQNSFLSVSQLVDSHSIESNVQKTDYTYFNQKPAKPKKNWKSEKKTCHQKNSYSAEALLRSQDASETDFGAPSPATFSIDFQPDSLETPDLITGQVHSKVKTYSQRFRKQDCWKGQDLRQAPAIISNTQQFPAKTAFIGKPPDGMPIPFSYLPDTRLPAPPIPPCSATPLTFPRFPSNPPTAPLLPGFSKRKNEGTFPSAFPASPGSGNRYPGPKKPYSYPRSNKPSFPPFSPSFSGDVARKPSGKPLPIPSTFAAPIQPAGPSGSSLANFNLSTILDFPDMNKKGSYPYP